MNRIRHMHWGCLLLLGVAACTSVWERHQQALDEDAAAAEWKAATAEARWLADNAFRQAPAGQRAPADDADRQLRLAQLAIRAGDTRTALEALREALTIDPSTAPLIQRQLDALPLSATELDRVKREFAWNIAALAPSNDALIQQQQVDEQCWSYRVREVRIRHQRTVHVGNAMERQVTYDARAWIFDPDTRRWRADGAWVEDIGTEVEPVAGPQRPRYRALIAAPHQFFTDATIPPCHRHAWKGPFDTDGTVFITPELPAS